VSDTVGTIGGVTDEVDALTPVQRRTLAVLRRGDAPLRFPEALVDELTADVEEAFAGFAARLGEETIWVNKHRLSAVLGCEAQSLVPDDFAWSPANATGQVAHRAIQLMIHWRGDPTPIDLVDEAIARLADADTSLGDWIAALGPGDDADLRGAAVERVTKFAECFPPLDKRAAPMTEARVQWPLDGPIVLSGKVDLVIGRPSADESRKVIVDLKTGRVAPRHRDDLRFYALLETLRARVPPRKLASFYLDVGEAHVEDVTEAVLRTAARRLLDGVHALVELTVEGRPPVKRPGPPCRWCPLLPTCDEGAAHLGARPDADDE
jgi:CRISPR/Cas system-associated exonuclease Cas4 (RecB family)